MLIELRKKANKKAMGNVYENLRAIIEEEIEELYILLHDEDDANKVIEIEAHIDFYMGLKNRLLNNVVDVYKTLNKHN